MVALTRSSSNDISRPVIRLGSNFAGPYDDNPHRGFSTPGLKSLPIVSSLQDSLALTRAKGGGGPGSIPYSRVCVLVCIILVVHPRLICEELKT